jgi:hypothetical protein
MDPNKTLEAIRGLIKAAKYDNVVYVEDADYMFELVKGLDEWLSMGGYLPLDWTTTPYD